MTQRIRSLKRQLNEAEEEASRKEAQYRHTQRELTEERETTSRLQKQLLDQHLQTKYELYCMHAYGLLIAHNSYLTLVFSFMISHLADFVFLTSLHMFTYPLIILMAN